jgi:hypothetical protein
MTDNHSDILLHLARQQEQQEAAMEGVAKLYADAFNVLVANGLTRDEALRMTEVIMRNVMQQSLYQSGKGESDD